ncbi:hypothetical protein ACH4U6_16445 [Streptomyces netropsis]|uniref:hypothetical protein n=1 Tax=Streptomyces netropsis TaxID=55404 RepID=UPI00378BD751
MADTEVTQAERVERLRARLTGNRAERRKRAAPSRGANLMFGVMLHGCARLEAGLPLTELEQHLVDALRVGLSEEEVCEFGRVYQEEAVTRGACRLFPESLTTRPLADGYAIEDLAKDLPVVAPEVLAQPNVSVVNLDRLQDGEPFDTPEFLAGLADYGHGITVVTADSREEILEGQDPAPFHAKLEMSRFTCTDESNEWSESDEIYWSSAAAADYGEKVSFISPAFGSVDKGSTKTFPPGSVIYDGPATWVLVCDIQCWERDHSPPEWWSKLRDVLWALSGTLFTLAASISLLGLLPGFSEMYGWIEAMAVALGLSVLIIDLIWNADDLVLERPIGFTRAAMAKLADSSTQSFVFNGGDSEGAHTLELKWTGAKRTNNVALFTHNASGWSSSPALPWPGSKTNDAPALAMHNGNLYCAVRGMGNQIFVSRRETNGQWSAFGQVPGASTRHSPALASYNNKLFVAYTGMDDKGYYATASNGSDWGAPLVVANGYACSTGPALAVNSGRLWYTTFNSRSQFMVSSMGLLGGWWLLTSFETLKSPSAPGMVNFQDKLYVAFRGTDNSIILNTRAVDDYPWMHPIFLPGRTTGSPALAVRGNTLYCAIRGQDDQLYLASTSGTDWSTFQQVTTTAFTHSGPAIAAPSTDELCLVYRSSDF